MRSTSSTRRLAGRLLLQTYALTGDLGASRAAVRDAFVVAWHHWRKVSRLDDPENAVRPNAWRHAQRRHTARLWHREKGLDPEVKDDPRHPRPAHDAPAQGAAADPAGQRLDRADGPRDRVAAGGGGAGAAGRRGRVHPDPRGSDGGHPRRLRAPRAGDRGQPLPAADDHPAGGRCAPAYSHHRGCDRRGGGVPGQRRAGDRRGRRTTQPGPRGRRDRRLRHRGAGTPRAAAPGHRDGDRHPAQLDLRPPLLDRGAGPTPTARARPTCCPASASRTPTRPVPRHWCAPTPAPASARVRRRCR